MVLSGFICAILVVIFHYLVFYSVNGCNINYQHTRLAKFEVMAIYSQVSPYYVKARLNSIESCPRAIRPAPFAMLSIATEQTLRPGSVLSSEIKLKPYRSVKNFHSFDQQRHALTERIFYKGRTVGEIKLHSYQPHTGLRNSYQEYINTITQDTHLHWLYYALLTGDRGKIAFDDKKQLQQLGLSHLLAISGLHIGLIYAFGFYFVKWMIRATHLKLNQSLQLNNIYIAFGFSCAFVYVYLSDFIVSASRALIMLACYLLIYSLGRNPLRWRSVLYALGIVLLIDPFALLNPGLYFSFTAVTIIFLLINKSLEIKLGFMKRFVQLLQVQLALFLGLLPLSLYYFSGTSVVGLAVNLIAIPVVGMFVLPILIFYSLISSIFDISWLLYFVDSLLFICYQQLVSIPTHWRWMTVSHFDLGLLIISYVSLLIFLFSPYKRFSVIPILIYAIECQLTPKVKSQLDVFDVGHGLMVMISANKKAIVYDLGPQYFARYDFINKVLIKNIKARELSVLATVISHRDNDHAGGLTSWRQAGYGDTLNRFHPNGIAMPCESLNLVLAEMQINSFNAQRQGNNRNDNSCLLKVSLGKYSILLSGDISSLAERALIENGEDLRASILLSPHHGSNTSSSNEFIGAVNPDIVIHSAAYQGQWHFPHPEVVKRYNEHHIAQFSTAEHGHIRIKFYNDTYRLEFARGQESFWFDQD